MTQIPPGSSGRQKIAGPGDAPLIQRASNVIREGRFQEALAILEGEESHPGDSVAILWTLKGLAFEGTGRDDLAEDAYWKALAAADPLTVDSFLALGLLKDRTGDREKGLWVLEEGLKHFPDHPDLLREAGILYGLTGVWDKALPLILAAYRADPSREDTLMAFGPIVDRLGLMELYGEMHQAFKALLERFPENPAVQDWYGRSLERLEKSQAALKYFRALLRKSPRDTRLLGHVARLARNVNESARALDTYRLLMEETGESVEIYLAMAETHKMNGKPLPALPLVRRVLALEPENREARILLGMIAIDQGDPEKAEAAFEGLDHAPAHYQLGDLYLRKKDPGRAMWSLFRGFTANPDPYYGKELLKLLFEAREDFLFLETLAWMTILFPKTRPAPQIVKLAQGRFPEPLDPFSHADPEYLALQGLANALLPNRDRDLAYRLLEQAVTVDPLSEVLYWVLAMIDEDRQDWLPAARWYEKIKNNSREPATVLHRIAENRHNDHPGCDLVALLEDFIGHYGPRPGFFRVLAEISGRNGETERSLEFLRRGMRAFPEDASLFALFRSLEPGRWKTLLES